MPLLLDCLRLHCASVCEERVDGGADSDNGADTPTA
jgi:hypothetical protein